MIKRRALTFIFTLSVITILSSLTFGLTDKKTLIMATTTSTDNTGLLDYLIPKFTKETGIKVKWVAVGTGKALELGKNCDVDLLLVHAPEAEKKFIRRGYGIERKKVMYNDFVIIGPRNDPAQVKGLSAKKALKRIMETKAIFVSRGDDSGTNKKEKKLWQNAIQRLPEKETWYIQSGQGMLATINMAEERHGYTLTDRGTFIKYEASKKGRPELVILVEGDPELFNQYSVIIINKERCHNVRLKLAKKFSNWITSPKAQKFISEFKLLGKQLFIPNAK